MAAVTFAQTAERDIARIETERNELMVGVIECGGTDSMLSIVAKWAADEINITRKWAARLDGVK